MGVVSAFDVSAGDGAGAAVALAAQIEVGAPVTAMASVDAATLAVAAGGRVLLLSVSDSGAVGDARLAWAPGTAPPARGDAAAESLAPVPPAPPPFAAPKSSLLPFSLRTKAFLFARPSPYPDPARAHALPAPAPVQAIRQLVVCSSLWAQPQDTPTRLRPHELWAIPFLGIVQRYLVRPACPPRTRSTRPHEPLGRVQVEATPSGAGAIASHRLSKAEVRPRPRPPLTAAPRLPRRGGPGA